MNYNHNCTLCPLGIRPEGMGILRTRCVSGRGRLPAPIMLIGEAPGAVEDRTGFAFTGPSGDLLIQRLAEAKISERVFITNVCKCRPPANRTPTSEEASTCSSTYLKQEIEKCQPTIIVALGLTATSLFRPIETLTSGIQFAMFQEKQYTLLTVPHPSVALNSVSVDRQIQYGLQIAKAFCLEQGTLST